MVGLLSSVSIRIFVSRTLMIGLVDICHILVFFEWCNESAVGVRKTHNSYSCSLLLKVEKEILDKTTGIVVMKDSAHLVLVLSFLPKMLQHCV